MDSKKEIKAWHKVKISDRFLNAFRGMYVFYRTSRHFYILVSSVVLVLFFGFYLNVSNFEWMMLVFSIGFVVVSEVFNTAIEIDIDLTSPGYHPFARDTKDVAAAAVVLSIIIASIIGMIVFLPKIF
ncbi:diacylglycerol kinase [Candidatus Nomurabacteria bacterium CG_4_10_14_0_2_um_filter_30_12]|uniref:Diacylglycerol kinase n=2 Tax=Candidatus Nomuraibacteriota TaxID=1752729 RepID=A0A2J0MHA5_9BACT|nr:MAG: diacylglycerol kinase [Candidatus Nomurabacteria bacterium CG10_big_fil_rev_8_21_14_0_10_03_31_7]PIZ87353.1 MAG: diacylglycerol kinase [Candidatus Nomurabacteria bacterium CG_4_10_14_0_2_um_filter_30_12]